MPPQPQCVSGHVPAGPTYLFSPADVLRYLREQESFLFCDHLPLYLQFVADSKQYLPYVSLGKPGMPGQFFVGYVLQDVSLQQLPFTFGEFVDQGHEFLQMPCIRRLVEREGGVLRWALVQRDRNPFV